MRVQSLVKKTPWRRAWQPTPVFLPRESRGQRSLVGYGPWCYKRVRHDLATNQQQKQHGWLEVPSSVLPQILDLFKTLNFSFPKTNTHTHTHTPPPHINCCCHVAQLCLTLCNSMDCSTWGRLPCPSPSPSLLKLKSVESVMPSNHLILCGPLFLLPSVFPSFSIFSNESALRIRWPKYWSFSFSISPSNEYSGLFSFRIDWFDLLGVQETLKSLLQHHSSKASILQCPAYSMVQLSHPYMTTGKTTALTRWTLVGKVMSLLCKYTV